MCGIAGFTHKNRKPDPELIRKATMCMVHRGPDQQGVHESSVVSMGAARLSIIDLAHGNQPIASDDGDTVIVFNGEIYNHAELREELAGLGHAFHSRCDTEVVLHAFLQWDTECFRRLRGMFAIALWRESGKRLVLARDRVGIKPLYLCRRGQDLYFGSELKTILVHPEIERQLDWNGLEHYLSFNYVPCPYTLVKGIEKLPPGHWLEWRDGKVASAPYWQVEFKPQRWALEDARQELDRLLRASVREHMIADVPLGVWASGGLDSSTMVHYAAEACPTRLKTFSVSFLGRSFDESRYFRAIARKYGTDHHELDLNPSLDLVAAIEKLAYYSDEPSADAGALPVWFLSEMTRKHVSVALSGEGADELFGGYYTYLADRYARTLRRTPASLRRMGLAALGLLPVSDEKISLEYKLKRFLQGSLLAPDAAHVFWNGAFSEEEKSRLLLMRGRVSLDELYSDWPGAAGINRYIRMDQSYYLTDDILYKCDRMSMAHSLEVRPAFLDHRIIEFAATLPVDLKVHGSTLKYLLKELMRDKLPREIVTRRKEGFDIPSHEWFRGPLKSLLLDTLSPGAIRRTGVFDEAVLSALIRNHMERRGNFGFQLWGLLILFLWIRQWTIQIAPDGRQPAEVAASLTN